MAKKLQMVDGLVWSGRGNSPWWGVGKNTVDGGRYYVVADLKCDDGKVRTRSYKPKGFNMTEREAALIATELYHRDMDGFPEGHEIDPKLSTGIKFRINGRFITCIDKNGHPVESSQAAARRSKDNWTYIDRPGDTKTGIRRGELSGISSSSGTGKSMIPVTESLESMSEKIRAQVSEDDWMLTKIVMEDAVGERDIHPAVKKLIKSILNAETA